MTEEEIEKVAQAINEQYQGPTIPPDELREMAIAAIKAIRASLSLEGERG